MIIQYYCITKCQTHSQQAFWWPGILSHLNLKALDNHSVPEQSHATNSSCHQLFFNDINVYKIAAFIHLHKSDYFLSLQGNPSFNCFEGADLKTWCSIAHLNSCILTCSKSFSLLHLHFTIALSLSLQGITLQIAAGSLR